MSASGPISDQLRKERIEARNERMGLLVRIDALEKRLTEETVRLDSRFDHQREWIKALDDRVGRTEVTLTERVIPMIRNVSESVVSVGQAVKAVSKGQSVLADQYQQNRDMMTRLMDTLVDMQHTQQQFVAQIVDLRAHHDSDMTKHVNALSEHKKTEGVLTKAGLLVGGLWATTVGLVSLAVYNHGWPWLRDVIVHYLKGGTHP